VGYEITVFKMTANLYD